MTLVLTQHGSQLVLIHEAAIVGGHGIELREQLMLVVEVVAAVVIVEPVGIEAEEVDLGEAQIHCQRDRDHRAGGPADVQRAREIDAGKGCNRGGQAAADEEYVAVLV